MSVRNVGYLILFVFLGMVTSCSKENPEDSGSPSLINGTITGNIGNYISLKYDTLVAFTPDTTFSYLMSIGVTNLSKSGDFYLALQKPGFKYTKEIGLNKKHFVGTISDPTVRVSPGGVQFYIIKNNYYRLYVQRANYSNINSQRTVGDKFSLFIYSDALLKLDGEFIDTIRNTNTGVTTLYTEQDQFTLEKGWNELLVEFTFYREILLSQTYTYKVTNRLDKDLKWVYLDVINPSKARSSKKYGSFGCGSEPKFPLVLSTNRD
ncbi:MAG: hypothetical protein ACOYOT_04215 [Bacteroidales bacterium]